MLVSFNKGNDDIYADLRENLPEIHIVGDARSPAIFGDSHTRGKLRGPSYLGMEYCGQVT